MELLQQTTLLNAQLATGCGMFTGEMMDLVLRFILNLAVVGGIVRLLYYPKSKRDDYLFTFILISSAIFMLVYLMEGTKMKLGAALGLFAIFGIMRYRTETVPIREMTYLFFTVTISVVNAMVSAVTWGEIAVANLFFIAIPWFLESGKILKKEHCKYIKYDNIKLIKPEKRAELIADLKLRTGLKITRVEVGSIDFLRDCTIIKAYYEGAGEVNTVNEVTKLPD